MENRRGMVGGLILILLGGFFLAAQLMPEIFDFILSGNYKRLGKLVIYLGIDPRICRRRRDHSWFTITRAPSF